MWIARDGELYLFAVKPILYEHEWSLEGNIDNWEPVCFDSNDEEYGIHLCSDLFPEVTFENSPKELIIRE